jgi:hypothetical protein
VTLLAGKVSFLLFPVERLVQHVASSLLSQKVGTTDERCC